MHQIHVVQIRSRNKSAKQEMVWCRSELKASPGTDRDNRSSIVPLHWWRCGPKSNSTASARRRNFQLLVQRLDRKHPATSGHESTSRHALVVISHHADVAVLLREGADDEILRAVGILVFVDEDVLEAILILLFDVRRLAKQSHDLQQQVVKIQGVLLPQRALVSVKDARYDLLIPAVGPFRVGEVVDAFVFGPIDQGEDDGRREAALVQPQVFEALADHGPLVVLVEDQEVPAHAYAVSVPAEDPAADVVESTDPDRPRHRRPDQPVDALPHLVGRFVGEGHRQDAGRRNALVAQQVSHPVGQHPRLAAPGTSQDQQRAAGVRDRFSLGRVQVLEQIHTWRSVYRTNTTYTTYTIYTITSKPFSTKFVSSGGCVGCVVCVG